MDKPNTPKGKSAEIISLPTTASQKRPSDAALPKNDDVYLPGLEKLTSEYNALSNDEGLNKLEQTSLSALVAYTAHIGRVDETVVRSMVEARFSVAEISAIRRRDYEDAVRYLVDLDVNAAVN